jgi:uncharacterized protein (DUF305 family)
MEKHDHSKANAHANHNNVYYKLAVMAVLSFIAMYALMYSMVDSFANVVHNVNQLYMAGLMTMPMIIIELLIMRGMYTNRSLNGLILVISALLLAAFFLFIRRQTGVSDRQFLKSMIPHHAAAILMVKEAELHDPEVIELGKNIIGAQQKEIEQMKQKIKELESK